jgi:hypothetical protein
MFKYIFKYRQKQNDKTVIKTSSFKDEFLKELIRISAPDTRAEYEDETKLIKGIGRKVFDYINREKVKKTLKQKH